MTTVCRNSWIAVALVFELGCATVPDPSRSTGTIRGVIRDQDDLGVEGAVVILYGDALPNQREQWTRELGSYRFEGLPAGEYTVQVLAGKANVSKVERLEPGGRTKVDFEIEVQPGCAVYVIEPYPNYGSPASSYSSKLIEYE